MMDDLRYKYIVDDGSVSLEIVFEIGMEEGVIEN